MPTEGECAVSEGECIAVRPDTYVAEDGGKYDLKAMPEAVYEELVCFPNLVSSHYQESLLMYNRSLSYSTTPASPICLPPSRLSKLRLNRNSPDNDQRREGGVRECFGWWLGVS